MENQKELTFGQIAVGLTFNPSGSEEVTKAKQLSADLIDLVEDTLKSRTNKPSWMLSVFRTSAFNAAIAAQMAAVKILTWREE